MSKDNKLGKYLEQRIKANSKSKWKEVSGYQSLPKTDWPLQCWFLEKESKQLFYGYYLSSHFVFDNTNESIHYSEIACYLPYKKPSAPKRFLEDDTKPIMK